MSTTTTLDVTGLTCGNCVKHVSTEIADLAGVTDVQVELVAGGTSTVTVTSEAPIERAALDEAVDEAGDYTITAVR